MPRISGSAEAIRAELTAEAERAWGAERAGALGPALETMAEALRRLGEAQLDMIDTEPAFIGPRTGGAE